MFKRLAKDEGGGNTVEFAIIVVVLVLLTLGFVDFGRAAFAWNALQKAAQVGVREAVVRDPIVLPIKNHFVCNADTINDTLVGERCTDPANNGAMRPECDFGTFTCTATGCVGGAGGVSNSLLNTVVFDDIVLIMQDALPSLTPDSISIIYRATNLGFIGNPSGPVAEVTAQISGVQFGFQGLLPFAGMVNVDAIDLPTVLVTLTGEDLSDNTCEDQGLETKLQANGEIICEKATGGGGGGPAPTPLCF